MNWCRLQNNIVMELGQFSQDPNGTLFNSSIIWTQDMAGTAQPGWFYDPVAKLFSAPIQTVAQQWSAYQASAQIALDKTDVTMTRIAEAVSLNLTTWTTPDVVSWMQYRRLLRAILSQVQPAIIPTSLPPKPAYPVGT